MASAIFLKLQQLWPFSILKTDDLKLSSRLVGKLSVPEETKEFVFALEDPDSHAVVYLLAAQNLSEQSAIDADVLIKAVQPGAVLAQVAPSALADIQDEEKRSKDDCTSNVPTSSIEVLKQCFLDKFDKQQYESLAGSQIVQEIFGIGFYGHVLSAKRAAGEVNSHFILLESPYENSCSPQEQDKDIPLVQGSALLLQPTCMLPGKAPLGLYSSYKRFCVADRFQSQMLKSLFPPLDMLLSKEGKLNECQPGLDYQAPTFAQAIYPLLEDLYNLFIELPAMRKALSSAQNMLLRISEGKPVDTQLLSEVQNFRIAVEGLRIALNGAARYPLQKLEKGRKQPGVEFSELPSDEKCHALSAYLVRSQCRKFGSVVAIVDVGSLSGIRRHWNTSVPRVIADLATECFLDYPRDKVDEWDERTSENAETKSLLADKPVVAVGAGATAILGASSLSKALPASTLFKLASYKVPVSLKLAMSQFQRTAAIGISKILGPSKLAAPGLASAGTKTSTLKLTFSAEKIRAVTHTIIASAERTSLLAIRTSFYEIMRRRRLRTFRFAPLAAFGCSVGACSGLLLYGDGIESAAEAIPSVPMITTLGRGLQSLQQISDEVRQSNSAKINEALQSLMHNFRKTVQ